MVLQALEGVSDREARKRLRTDISWKVACGLPLTDEGFHPTVLTLWRNRLRGSDRPQRIFDAVREVIKETNVLHGRNRRVLDSTVLDDAVSTQDAVMQLVTAIRRVRREIPEAKAIPLHAHDYDNDPGKPDCAWDDEDARDRIVTSLVTDALRVLDKLDGTELTDAQREAVGLLALVAGQDVEPGDEEGTWRIAEVTRPGRMVSAVDPESRHKLERLSRRLQGALGRRAGDRPHHGMCADAGRSSRRTGGDRAARGGRRASRDPRRLRLRRR
jgi:hypothetical protein